MKKLLLKKLLAFIVMMFSIYFVNGQCQGNKVLLCKSTRTGCITKCVSPGQVQKYLSRGWFYFCSCTGPFVLNSNNKIQGSGNEQEDSKKQIEVIK